MPLERQCTEAQFLKDAGGHLMTVLRDDGIHRHLRFRKGPRGSSEYWFDLITWPGSLCIDGDMGTYVFRRLDDMFEFFRTDREYNEKRGRKLGINPQYWGEKLQATANHGGHLEFSKSDFRRRVIEQFDNWVLNNNPEGDDEHQGERQERVDFNEKRTALRAALTDEVLNRLEDGETRAYDAAMNFSCDEAPSFTLSDCWEWNCKEYTFHFLWCCYAVAWGIKVYDDSKLPTGAGSEAVA